VSFVLDATVALSWAFDGEGGGYVEDVLAELEDSEARVASVWPIEVSNGLATAERLGRLEPADTSGFLSLLTALPIQVDPGESRRVFDAVHRLARNHEIPSSDASYLDLALRLGLPLATLDARLRNAAGREGVRIFSP
jgi:predicted nucleic acid-binding protein